MPVIHAHILKGRPAEIKRRLAAALTTAMCDTLDLEPKSVHVIIEEHERENWAMGGELFSDRSSSPKATAEIDLDSLFKKPAPEKTKPAAKPAAKAPPRKPSAKSRSRR
jgi:4-oxalocrotonate tautomerase